MNQTTKLDRILYSYILDSKYDATFAGRNDVTKEKMILTIIVIKQKKKKEFRILKILGKWRVEICQIRFEL